VFSGLWLYSRDRVIAAVNCEEPDRVPIYLRPFERNYLMDNSKVWRSQFERVEMFLSLGLDDILSIQTPLTMSSEVEVRVFKKIESGEEYPLLVKEYHTSKGVLRHVVRMTRDWPHGEDIPIFSDYIVPKARTKKYLVEGEEDLDALSVLFRRPEGLAVENFLKEADVVREFAEENNVLVEGWGPMGGDAVVWLCGVENVIRWAFTKPEFLMRLLRIVLGWDLWSIELLSKVKCVDLIIHRGWYENINFWPPRLYKKFIAPILRREADEVHKSGLKFGYIMTTGVMPILDYVKDCEVDLLLGIDPVQDRVDFKVLKEKLDGRVCVWGGVNSAVTLRSTRAVIKRAVYEAIENLAPGGGFILGAVDALFKDTPSEGVGAFIEAWREKCAYPRNA